MAITPHEPGGTSPLIEMRGISKSFGGVRANDSVDLVLGAGEILGLLGENGAGKTTLMNILFGVYQADHGTIAVEGKPVRIQSAADAVVALGGRVVEHYLSWLIVLNPLHPARAHGE